MPGALPDPSSEERPIDLIDVNDWSIPLTVRRQTSTIASGAGTVHSRFTAGVGSESEVHSR